MHTSSSRVWFVFLLSRASLSATFLLPRWCLGLLSRSSLSATVLLPLPLASSSSCAIFLSRYLPLALSSSQVDFLSPCLYCLSPRCSSLVSTSPLLPLSRPLLLFLQPSYESIVIVGESVWSGALVHHLVCTVSRRTIRGPQFWSPRGA